VDEFYNAELKEHLETCTECSDPNKDGSDAHWCPEAELLFKIFRVQVKASEFQFALVN
jgi:hypothetical protein